MAEEKPLIVVLGLGEMGLEHARNLSKVRRIRLGLASTRPDVLSSTTEELAADRSYPSYESALADVDVAAIVISTPPDTHPDLICRAARARKHIFCEKPLGPDSGSIANAVAVAEEMDVVLMTGFQRRWDDSYRLAHQMMSSEELGKPIVVKCTSGDKDYPEKYRRDAAPHTLLKDLAVHDIDLARWLTSSEVRRVYAIADAMTYPKLRERRDADVGVVVMEMENGAKAMIHLSRALKYGYNASTEIVCTEGTYRVGDLGHVDLDVISHGLSTRSVDSEFRSRFVEAFEEELKVFAKVVLSKGDKEVLKEMKIATGVDGLKATIVAEALVKSSETGMPVTVEY